MRQLLIVNSAKALGAGGATPYDLSKLEAGALFIHELDANIALTTAPTKNFAIALGRANGQMPFLIPEVDVTTLNVTKSIPMAGSKYKVVFAMPTPVIGKEYTLRFYKKGAVPHERNSWSISIVAKTATAATEAQVFANMINAKANDKFRFKASVSSATVTIESEDYQAWSVTPVDGLATVALTITEGIKPTNDKAYIQNLASICAAGKGFRDTYGFGITTIPGYPEVVEDKTYYVYTLRFKVGRDASKTRDERVWQNVYIAVPTTSTIVTTLDKVFIDTSDRVLEQTKGE